MLLLALFSLLFSSEDSKSKNRKLTEKEKSERDRLAWEMSEEYEDP